MSSANDQLVSDALKELADAHLALQERRLAFARNGSGGLGAIRYEQDRLDAAIERITRVARIVNHPAAQAPRQIQDHPTSVVQPVAKVRVAS